MFVALLLLGLTALKETPAFWLNSGGYPPALRSLVLQGYYPILLTYLTLLVALTAVHVARGFRGQPCSAVVSVLSLCPAWIVSGLCLGLLLANNVINLFEGKPFHHH